MAFPGVGGRWFRVLVGCAVPLVASFGSANSLWPDDCTWSFEPRYVFETTETVCVTGDVDYTVPGQLFASAHVYVVKNRQWQLGDHFVDHYSSPTLIVSTMGAGAFVSEVVQLPPLEPGEYDLVLDEHGDGVYTADDLVLGVGSDFALVVVTQALFADGLEYGTAAWSRVVGSTYGTEIDGIPEWYERGVAVLNNAARIAPQDYKDVFMADHVHATDDILLSENHPPAAPLVYREGLNRSARFHADDLWVNQCGFQHDSCDGTPASTRVNSFLSPPCWYSGELLHINYSDPRRQVNEWLCDFDGGDGCCPDGEACAAHRDFLLSASNAALGVGVSPGFVVQDYSSCSEEFKRPLVDGSHLFFEGNLLFVASFFDSPGYPPEEVVLVIDGVEHAMNLATGLAQAGTYTLSLAHAGACRSYVFRAVTSRGLSYRFPETGALRTFGDGCSETWVP